MTESPPWPAAKDDPARLPLRARPRPVTRLSRRVLIGSAAVAGVAVAAALWYALDGGGLSRRGGGDPFSTDNKPQADGLAGLPRSYADLPRTKPPPLGPPLPGDLGRPPAPPMVATGDPDAERTRREAEQAAASKVFFSVAAKPVAAAPTAAAAPVPGAEGEAAAPAPALDADSAQNLQDRKRAFLDQPVARGVYSPQTLQTPRSPYQLMAGTVIAAALVTGLTSDLPGQVIAQVTEAVYDSVGGRFLLIPQGSRLIGTYDSVVAYGQQRVLLIWTRLILPDGSSIVLDNLPASDTGGHAGLEDGVDYHTWRLLKGIALSTLLGVSSELAANSGANSGNRLIIAGRDSADGAANQAGQRIVQKDLAIQPSLTVRPGWPLRVIVQRDIIFR